MSSPVPVYSALGENLGIVDDDKLVHQIDELHVPVYNVQTVPIRFSFELLPGQINGDVICIHMLCVTLDDGRWTYHTKWNVDSIYQEENLEKLELKYKLLQVNQALLHEKLYFNVDEALELVCSAIKSIISNRKQEKESK